VKKIFLVSAIITLAIIVSFAVNAPNAKAETLEECIKKYQAMGLSYDNAKLKCSNIQAPVNTQITPSSQTQPLPASVPQPLAPTNQGVSDPCIQKYMDAYKLSYDEAKTKCYTPQNQVSPTPPIQTSTDDCIKDYMSQTGNTYEDAKAKCAPPTPYVQPIAPSAAPQNSVDACVQKYLNSGSSSEEAKKNCSQQQPTATTASETSQQITPVESCIKKYMEVFKISYDDAKAKCVNIPQPTATAIQVIEKRSNCADLENQLAQLTQKIQSAQGQEADKIMAEIKKIKQEFTSCQAPVSSDPCVQARKNIYNSEQQLQKGVSATETNKIKTTIEENNKQVANCGQVQATPTIKNPCDEIPGLKTTYEAMLKKEVQMKDLISQGQMDKTSIDDLERQMEFMKKSLEQMQFACQQGNKTVEESPCGRLTKLQMLYSQNQDQNLVKEITALKEKCLTQNLSSEKTDSLVDVEQTYKTKIKAVIENTFGQDQVNNLKQTEDQKNKLVSEVINKAKELDATNISIIKKISIGGNKIFLDGIQGNPVPVKIDVNGKEININQSNGNVVINEKGIKAEGNVKVEYQDGKLTGTNSGKPINVMPSEIKDKVGAQPSDIKIQDNEKPEYVVKVDAKVKLLGFIPISASKNYLVDAETGTSQETKPWWSFLVTY